jgi:threonine/homoserine/homoserine lactone efflux protein
MALPELLPPWPLLAAFLAAGLLLAVTPGPGVLYIVARSLAQGRRHGLTSVAGVALGNLVNALGASLGLAAVFLLSSSAFLLVKYAGAAYLLYLGIRLLRDAGTAGAVRRAAPAPTGRVFRDGLVVALLNPKTTLFFAAFLPQFMSVGASPVLQGATLGALFVALAAFTDALYALAAASAAPWFARRSGLRAGGRYLTAGTFIGLGLFAAFSGTRGER